MVCTAKRCNTANKSECKKEERRRNDEKEQSKGAKQMNGAKEQSKGAKQRNGAKERSRRSKARKRSKGTKRRNVRSSRLVSNCHYYLAVGRPVCLFFITKNVGVIGITHEGMSAKSE